MREKLPDYSTRIQVALLITLFLSLILFLAAAITAAGYEFTTESALLSGALIDALLTIYLINIYSDMADFQEKQADLVALQHKPRLRVRDYELVSSIASDSAG